MSKFLGTSPDSMAPIIYLIIALVGDYVTWEDTVTTKMLFSFLKNTVKGMLEE